MRSFAIATLLSAACAVNAATFTVHVAQSGLSYSPNTINASVGDTVTFIFDHSPHTVTQSPFTSPCTKQDGGFDSGQQSTNSVFNYSVTSTNGIFFHCGVATHCRSGMVGSINVDSATFAAFQAAAKSGTSPSATGSGTSAASASAASGASSKTPASTASGSGTSAAAATASSAARQVNGGSVLGAAMALLVGLAL